jgi:hypothetical protein
MLQARWFRTATMLLAVVALLVPAARAQGTACTQEQEPNDTPAAATLVSAPGCVEGSLAGQDQDAFTWVVDAEAASAPWVLRIEGIPGQVTQVDIVRVTFADNGQDVVAAERMWTFGTTDGRVRESDAFWLAPGRYTLGVSKSGGEGTYRIDLERAVVDSLAAFGAVDEVRSGSFALRGDQSDGAHTVAWQVGTEVAGPGWVVEAAAALGERLTVVLRSGDTVLKEETIADGGTVEWTDLDLAEGEYRIELTGSSPRPAPFLVRASREEPAAGATEREPNDTWDTANELPTDEPLTGRLTAGDVDLFTFEVDEALAQHLLDLVIDTDVTVEVALLDADRAVLQQRRGAGGALRSLYLPEGSYGFSIRGEEGPYQLSFRHAGSPQPGVELEPNDTAASAQPLDETLTMRGHLTLADVDTFSFVVGTGGARYRVQALGHGDGLERVTLATAGGRTVETAVADAGRARIDDVTLAPGTYLVSVEGRDSEYALRLLDLGTVEEPPPVLEARTDDGEDAPLTVTTVESPVAGPAPAPASPSGPDAPAGPAPPARDAPGTATPLDVCAARPAADADAGRVTLRFDDDARLSCGDHLNTIVAGDAVMLDPEAAAFRFIWVAASRRGTVIKIDTDTGDVVGEYWTAPVYDPERPSQDPSRTVVDRNGNVWVGNRRDDSEGMGSVVKIGLLENGQCEDRNGNGTIDTSTGLGDVRDWDNAADADRMGGVTTAEDECVLQFIRVHSRGVRHASVDLDGNVWVSGTSDRHFDLIDGTTGEILRTERAPCGGYGGLVDRAGVMWSARPLLRWDPREPLTRDACLGGQSYGIGLDYDDHAWISDFNRSVCRYSHTGEVEACFDAGEGIGSSRGVAVTRDNHVWVVHSSGSSVTRFDPDGTIVARIGVAGGPTGVSIDARGKPWIISGVAQRIDPDTNEIDLTVNLDGAFRQGSDELPFYDRATPYVYSDMTGQLVFGPPDSGTYTLRVRGPSYRTSWEAIRFADEVPEGGSVTVRVSSSDGLATAGGLRTVRSGDALDLEGQYLYVEVLLQRAPSGVSPTFGGLEIEAVPVPLAPGAIRVEARPDLVASSNAIEVILDASGSMGQLLPTGESRWAAARSALVALAESAFPSGVPVALRVSGHLEPATCHMGLELDLEPFEPEGFRRAVAGVEPKLLSQTPLADAILAAGDDLAAVEGQRMVVLVTDGEESCGGDPEAAIRSLRERGIATVNIIGFALQDEAVKEQFATWAELGGGVYLDTATGEELGAALNAVLQPEFVVYDPDGVEVGRGRVNDEAVEVPSGVYRVQVLSTPGRVVEGVVVVERQVGLTVSLRE